MKVVRSPMRKAVLPIIVACVIAVPVAVGDSEPVWRQLAAAPTPRQEVSYTALGGYLYLAAGNDRTQSRYDPTTDQWTSVASMPVDFEGIDHVHGVAVGGRIVYAGGLHQWKYPFPVTGAVSIYNPVTDAFTSGSEMPSPRAAGGVAAWNGKLIYAGGLGADGAVARVDAYDPQTDEWTRLADMPRPREHFQAAVVGDELYAIGGRETHESAGSVEIDEIAAVDVLDLPADDAELPTATWRSGVTSLPTVRGGLGVAAIGECIYAIGGERESGVTGATESYDTSTGTWRQLAPLWTPRHGIQAATIGKTIYVAAGGTDAFGYSPTAAHEALDVGEVEPCLATASAASGAPARTAPLRIEHLSVRPKRVFLQSGPARRRGAAIVLVLSRAGRVLVRLPRRFSFAKRLHAGRNTLPLPRRGRGRLLPRGPYRLIAKPRAHEGGGRSVRAAFRVVG